MLYDPKWEKKSTPKIKRGWFSRWLKPLTPTEVFTVHDFIAWLETKGHAEQYDYGKPSECAMTQYFVSRGVRHSRAMMLSGPNIDDLYPGLWMAVNYGGGYSFGALLGRVRAVAFR